MHGKPVSENLLQRIGSDKHVHHRMRQAFRVRLHARRNEIRLKAKSIQNNAGKKWKSAQEKKFYLGEAEDAFRRRGCGRHGVQGWYQKS
jgi:hypothetical protein